MHQQLKTALILFWAFPLLLCGQNYVRVAPHASDKALLEAALAVRPSERQMAWQEMEYYGFVHFGINTFTGEEWSDGTNPPELFNPTALDAEQWVATFKAAGMKGLILTAKHHDGFCLWPTKTTDYSVARSPWRNGQGDLVREVADACRRHGLKMGIYLSPWDRNHPTYGDTPAYNRIFCEQLTELLTNYGDMFEVWFDGANGEGPNGKVQQYDFERFYALIRQLQPKAVIAIMGPDVRWVGNEAGQGRDPEWSVLPIETASEQLIAENSQHHAGENMFVPKDVQGEDLGSRQLLKGTKALIWYPSEVDTSIRPGWFYHAEQDDKVKSLEHLENIYYTSVGMNATLLLNVPPDRRGRIHPTDSTRLMKLRQRLDRTFAQNLIKQARIKTCSRGKNKATCLIDSNNQTFWKAPNRAKTPIIEFQWRSPITADRLVLQENIRNGQRIEHFVLEAGIEGRWQEIARGKTVGYKRIIRFPATQTHKIRLRITGARAVPELAEAGIFSSEK